MSNVHRIALLTNFLAPYRTALLKEICRRFDDFRILVVAPVEPSRNWTVDWRGLPVQQQRTLSIRSV